MNDTLLIVLGAALAIGGGWISDEIRAWRERRRELKSIKVAIGDELSEIETTINNMNEVWTQSKVLYPKYTEDLRLNTTAFDKLRARLFLITDDKLRKKIVAFYKSLRDKTKESDGKIGTLAETPDAIAEQSAFATNFQKLGTDAKTIREELEV